MRVRLERLESTHRNLRTDHVEGDAERMPQVGVCFRMLAPGLEFGTRFIETSPVVRVDDGGVFHTANSTYKLTEI